MASEVLISDYVDAESPRTERTVRARFWRKLKSAARQIPFIDEVVAGYYCAIDSTTPKRVRTALFGALAYFILPLDLIPDFIIGTGYTDDIAVLWTTLQTVRNHILPRHREAARAALADRDDDAE